MGGPVAREYHPAIRNPAPAVIRHERRRPARLRRCVNRGGLFGPADDSAWRKQAHRPDRDNPRFVGHLAEDVNPPAAAKPLIALFAIDPDLSREQARGPLDVDVVIPFLAIGADLCAFSEQKSDAIRIAGRASEDRRKCRRAAYRMKHQPQLRFGWGPKGGFYRWRPLRSQRRKRSSLTAAVTMLSGLWRAQPRPGKLACIRGLVCHVVNNGIRQNIGGRGVRREPHIIARQSDWDCTLADTQCAVRRAALLAARGFGYFDGIVALGCGRAARFRFQRFIQVSEFVRLGFLGWARSPSLRFSRSNLLRANGWRHRSFCQDEARIGRQFRIRHVGRQESRRRRLARRGVNSTVYNARHLRANRHSRSSPDHLHRSNLCQPPSRSRQAPPERRRPHRGPRQKLISRNPNFHRGLIFRPVPSAGRPEPGSHHPAQDRRPRPGYQAAHRRARLPVRPSHDGFGLMLLRGCAVSTARSRVLARLRWLQPQRSEV